MTEKDEFAGFAAAPSSAPDGDEFSGFAEESPKPPEEEKPANTWWGAVKGDADAALALGSRAVAGPIASLARSANRAIPDWGGTREPVKEHIDKTENALTYDPHTAEGKYALKQIGKVVNPIAEGVSKATGAVVGDEYVPAIADLVNSIPTVKTVSALGTAGRAASSAAKATGRVIGAPFKAYGDLVAEGKQAAASDSAQSMGAARAATSTDDLSPPLQQAFKDASRETGSIPNLDAAERHAEADRHGVQLTKGQATRDATQYSNEVNSTHPDIVKRLGDQNQQLTDAIDGVRRDAAPGHVQNDPIENGQIAVDALKAYDEPVKAAIDAKYAAARQASASGDLQMDGSSFVSNANKALKPQSKFRFLPATAKGILDDVDAAGGKMSLDDYEAYDTQLGNEIAKAKAAGDGNAATAIGKVRDALHSAEPIGEETAKAKELFKAARASAKARFDELDADPAYEAAVNDLSLNGVKKGKPSALADKFLDRYALQAPKANVDRFVGKLDPDAQQAVAAHTLGTIRKAAVSNNGVVTPSGYAGAVSKYGSKLDSLVSPETRESLDSLGRVIHNVKVAPPGHFVNSSKSGVISNAAHGVAQPLGEAVINSHTFGMGVPIIKGISENNFAKRSLAPGAGLKTPPISDQSMISRASGGKVDQDALVNALINRWKAAKRATDKSTKPLLYQPDSVIVRALDIAQEHI